VKRFLISLALVAGTTLTGVAFSSPASALTPPDPSTPVTQVDICHAAASDQNPYVINHPSVQSDSTEGVPLVGHGGHTGGYWYPDHPDGFEWGDIIPPFTYEDKNDELVSFPGLNWGNGGQAVYENDCALPHATAPAPTVTAPTCENPQGSINFTNTDVLSYVVTPEFDGPGDYTVTVTAIGPVILDEPTSWELTVPTGPECRSTVTASPPTVTAPTCSVAGVLNVPADTDAIDYSVSPAYLSGASGDFTVTATVDSDVNILKIVDGDAVIVADSGTYDFPTVTVAPKLAADNAACPKIPEAGADASLSMLLAAGLMTGAGMAMVSGAALARRRMA
jgi:hypothetical protein